MRSSPSIDGGPRGVEAPGAAANSDQDLAERLKTVDPEPVHREFLEHGRFVHQQQFLPDNIIARLVAAASAVEGSANRSYLPGHKQGGSVSRHTIDALAPCIADLYRSPTLVAWLQRLAGERLQLAPAADPHAYALYFYTHAGDHIGWHYDRSYYQGRRYTLLFGVLDDSSCRLDYELHTREPDRETESGSLRLEPGGLVFFDGDKLRHRITPLEVGERRVSLTFEYVTDPRMQPWWRLISNMKDAVAYFGLRQVFGGAGKGRAARPPKSA